MMLPNKKVLVTAALVVSALFLLGADGDAFISNEEAHAMVKSGGLLLDVRTPEEFAQGHIEGAVNIPVQELEKKLGSVPAKKDQPIVVYCRSGHRSDQAKTMLSKAGFSKVKNLGPMSAWK